MASQGLDCPICCERFDEEKLCPRLLSCGHSFCSNCLEKLFKEDAITCPTCRCVVSVPAGVAELSKNFALLDVLQAILLTTTDGNADLRSCQVCGGEKHPATSCCLDCKVDMCKDAAHWHTRQRTTCDHRVVSLEKLKANPKLAAVPIFCSEHNDQQYRFFDEECNHVVCRDCLALKHNGHNCLSLAEAAAKYQQEMEAIATKASNHAEGIKAAEARVAAVSLDLNKAYKEQIVQIKGSFKKLHAAITDRESVLLRELEQLYKTKAFALTDQRDRLHIFQTCLESAAHRTLCAVKSGNLELLVARNDIVPTLKEIENQPLVFEPQADCVLEFNVNLEQLLESLNDAGMVSDKTTSSVTTTAEGPGLNLAIPERKASFTITARDAQGRRRDEGGDMFMVELTENEGEKVECNVEDKGDGTYTATYTCPTNSKGNHKVSVLLRGIHIKGSPFSVNVTDAPVGKVSCYGCKTRKKSMIYYKNNTEPFRDDDYRVNGYSAVCTRCINRASPLWIKCCGPC